LRPLRTQVEIDADTRDDQDEGEKTGILSRGFYDEGAARGEKVLLGSLEGQRMKSIRMR